MTFAILYNRKISYTPYFCTISYTSHFVRKLGLYKNLSQLSFEPLLYMYAAHNLPCTSSCTKISTVRKACLWLCTKVIMYENLLLYSISVLCLVRHQVFLTFLPNMHTREQVPHLLTLGPMLKRVLNAICMQSMYTSHLLAWTLSRDSWQALIWRKQVYFATA